MRDTISIFIEFGQLVLELLSREALKCGGIHSLSHAVNFVVAFEAASNTVDEDTQYALLF
jgi:Ni,Fe-hydrogenase III large subunit